jgi:hypothetical protein
MATADRSRRESAASRQPLVASSVTGTVPASTDWTATTGSARSARTDSTQPSPSTARPVR